ncbi:MAG: DHHA1 domain-containing protein, partial [Clostridiales bacterium]|nr:DHHA1 domain-containing protein [Clostridiales bacterium]
PCINAPGRLEGAGLAARLFLSEDAAEAAAIASRLVELNVWRRELTESGFRFALELLEGEGEGSDKVLVLHCPQVHESVGGIVAGKVKEKYHRPAVILCGDKDLVRGSCRSVGDYNIFEGLLKCRDILEAFGGHPMAAGLSVKKDKIGELRRRLNEDCLLDEEGLTPLLRIDKSLDVTRASYELAVALQALEPFGKGNHQPFFGDKNVSLQRITLLGQNEQVMKVTCNKQGKYGSVDLISFHDKERLSRFIAENWGEAAWQGLLYGKAPGVLLDIVYTVNVNEFNGRSSLQLQLVDFRMGGDKE